MLPPSERPLAPTPPVHPTQPSWLDPAGNCSNFEVLGDASSLCCPEPDPCTGEAYLPVDSPGMEVERRVTAHFQDSGLLLDRGALSLLSRFVGDCQEDLQRLTSLAEEGLELFRPSMPAVSDLSLPGPSSGFDATGGAQANWWTSCVQGMTARSQSSGHNS